MTTVAANTRLESLEYRFSVERLAELNRSPAPLLLARLNSACPSHGKTHADVDDPVALAAEIRANCADDDDYIRQSMPLQEIVFRTLLLADDQTMTLGELHSELTENWSSPVRAITVDIAGLAKILDSDVFYGFERLAAPEPEVIEPDLPMLSAADADSDSDEAAAATIGADDDDQDEADEEDLYEDDPYEEEDDDDDGEDED